MSTRNNFIIYVDRGGNMPQLRNDRTPDPWITHPYYVKYENNRPVLVKPYPGQKTVWDYAQSKYIPLGHCNIVMEKAEEKQC